MPHAMRETAPLLHEDELTQAARVLSAAAAEKRRRERSEYVRRHVAELLASINA
jgi:hypothetical protein